MPCADRLTMTDFCERHRITATAVPGVDPKHELIADEGQAEWRRTAHAWTVTLKRGRARLTHPFWQGAAHTAEPTAADVLACLVDDAQSGEETFEDWCSSCGYSNDSREAERVWKACRALAPRLRRFLGGLYETAVNCEH